MKDVLPLVKNLNIVVVLYKLFNKNKPVTKNNRKTIISLFLYLRQFSLTNAKKLSFSTRRLRLFENEVKLFCFPMSKNFFLLCSNVSSLV